MVKIYHKLNRQSILRINLFCLIFLGVSSSIFSQNSFDIDQRKGKLFFSTGMQYRITPYYETGSPSFTVPVNTDAQLSGPVLNLTLDFFITKNLSIGFTHGLRYDEVTNIGGETDNFSRWEAASNSLINSQHIYVDYHFKIFKESELFIRIGRSLLNNGTGYIERESFFADDGELLSSFLSSKDLTFRPAHFAIGFKKKRINIIAGTYVSTNNPFIVGNNALYIPYLEFKYSLFKL